MVAVFHISLCCLLTFVSLCSQYVTSTSSTSSSWLGDNPNILLQNLLITNKIVATKYPYLSNIKVSHQLQLQSNPSIQITEDEVLNYINSKRASNAASINRWNSTLVELKKVTKAELKFFSRTSFGNSTDLFENILKKGYKENKVNPFETGLIISIFLGAFISLFLLPLLPIDNNSVKNGIGLIGLTLPFNYMFIVTLFPDFLLKILKPDSSSNTDSIQSNVKTNNSVNTKSSAIISDSNENNQSSQSPSSPPSFSSSSSSVLSSSKRDRLCIHEAGHFLVGYLCGYPILNYEINGERGANLVIGALTTTTDTRSSSGTCKNSANDRNVREGITSDGNIRIEKSPSLVTVQNNNNSHINKPKSIRDSQREQEVMMQKASGSLLCISMAGIVAEALHYGDAIGGAEDWPLALQIINKYTQFNYNNKLYNSNTLVEEEYLTDENIDQYLRGAVVKCLVLLRIHRESLLKVAVAMSNNKSVIECIDAIESVPL